MPDLLKIRTVKGAILHGAAKPTRVENLRSANSSKYFAAKVSMHVEKRSKIQDTPEHATDHFLVYLQSSIVHCPVNTLPHGMRQFLFCCMVMSLLFMQRTAAATPIRQATGDNTRAL